MYLDFLEQYGEEYEQVLVADVRDVIFQSNVFEAFRNYPGYLGYATEGQLIGNDRIFNYMWLERGFGRAEADKLSDKKIICAGTVIGTVDEMKIFCRTMWNRLKNESVWGIEQAAMNYFIYENRLPIENLIEIDTYSGAILTAGFVKDNKIFGDKILRGDGRVPAVVHQYDRHAPLVELADRLYRDKNFQVDERFTDARSILDEAAYLLHIGRIDDAAQICMKNSLVGANIDSLLKLWEIILQKTFTPAAGYIELTIQAALGKLSELSHVHLNKICLLLPQAIKNNRAVYFDFKIFIANILFQFAEQNLNAKNSDECFYCMNIIDELNLPPNKDIHLLQAKAYRIFGRKDEALAAYKKALDLS